MKSPLAKTRIDEIDEMINDLNKKMSWTPGWLKDEVRTLVKLELEKNAILIENATPKGIHL